MSARCRFTPSSPPGAKPSTGLPSSSPSRSGTSAGDLVAEELSLGYRVSALIFAALIAGVAVAHYRYRLNAVLAFWAAYVLTRPLGASIGDYLSQPHRHGGLGLGTVKTSVVFLGIIFGLVSYLSATKRDAPASVTTA